jgi:CheY-like chemotaxis protein
MKNVLLVDDDKISNFLNAKAMEELGFVGGLHTAMNGVDAIRLINEYFIGAKMIPDIILLDLNMPVMDGFGFIEAFRKLRITGIDKVKIIIVTSSENPEDIKRVKELGIDQYLKKPINTTALRIALE